MKYLAAVALVIVLFGLKVASAQNTINCGEVLKPTVEQITSDIRRSQAYMYLYAAYEYDENKSGRSNSLGAGGSYAGYGVDYNQSESKEDFAKKVRQRLSQENFSKSDAEAQSYLKTGLTDAQVNAWQNCVTKVTSAAGFLLSARNVTNNGFTLVVSRVFPIGTIRGVVDIALVGGTVNSKKSLHETFSGSGSKVYEVKRDVGASAVRISGNFLGAIPDSMLVDYSLPPVKFEKAFQASAITLGYGVHYDAKQELIVSDSPNRGSDNFTLGIDIPRTGTYSIDAMWTSGEQTEVYIYSKPMKPLPNGCNTPNESKNLDADFSYKPSVTGGWTKASLPTYPDRVGKLLLEKGHKIILFTSLSCGGGLAGGRVPSTAWVRFREL